MKIGVVSTQVPFVHGGAEVHAANLIRQLQQRGVEAELITLPFKWYPPAAIIDAMAMSRLADLTEANGHRIDRIIGLKFPAYLVPHPNKVLWVLHQHRTAYELWDHPEFGDLRNFPEGKAVRDAIRHADERFLPEAKAIYANSRNVADRMRRFNAVSATPLYHPPADADQFYSAPAQNYLFFPSRITRLKRQDLVLAALAHCEHPVRVVFAGSPEADDYMVELNGLVRRHALDQRVEWLGFISNDEKRRRYAECLGVIYPPVDEDYGYITLEAMLSGKPVITTRDAGGPMEFVVENETGVVGDPTAQELAALMDELWVDRDRARQMGRAAASHYAGMGISWDHVVDVLTS